MTRHLHILPGAQTDLADIWTYTAERWSLAQARIYAAAMTEQLLLLCDHPDIAQGYGRSIPPVRIYRIKAHLVIFTDDGQMISVIRVVHARSNWQALFAD